MGSIHSEIKETCYFFHDFLSFTQVNLDSLSIDDLVDEAVLSNDVARFVFQVKRRFKNQQGLIREVEELQTKWVKGNVRQEQIGALE